MKVGKTNAPAAPLDHHAAICSNPLAAGLAGTFAAAVRVTRAATPKIDEYDPNNTKIATMVNARANDDQFLFLQQIGVRWVHVQFPLDTSFDLIKNTQERLASHNIKIHCGIVDHYRSQKNQLGRQARTGHESFKLHPRSGPAGHLQPRSISPRQYLHNHADRNTSRLRVREYSVDEFHKSVETDVRPGVYG
jgi:hypothetical protein